jgi:hypothetical protein
LQGSAEINIQTTEEHRIMTSAWICKPAHAIRVEKLFEDLDSFDTSLSLNDLMVDDFASGDIYV